MAKIQDPYTLLKAKALRLLARRDHSRAELKQKLAVKDADPVLIEKVLEECQQLGWQDELRFAQSYIRSRVLRLYGPIKIRYELKQRGVADDLIDHALEGLGIDWQALSEKAIQHKFGDKPADSWQEKGKRAQYLYQRGFKHE